MGLVVRSCCSWVLCVALVYGVLGFGCAGDASLVRPRRQADWWRNYQRAVPAQGSPSLGSRGYYRGSGAPVLGFSSSRGGVQWGSPGRRAGGIRQELVPTTSSPVSVQCEEDMMVVSVQRDFYGTGKLVKPTDLSLGSQNCKPSPQSTDAVIVFQNGLQDCGNTVQMNQDWVIYTTSLNYSPTSSIPIIRTNSAEVPIMCYYYRHGNVSSNAIKPTWVPFSTTVSSEERLSFSLRLMTEDWSDPRSSPIFQLGDLLYIEASVDTQNHIGLTMYIDRCVATISPDANSAPSYEIIADNGCLVDGMQDDSSSTFIAPRVESDKLQFTVDAFRFLEKDVSLIYITCYLRGAAATQVPDPMNKACSYSKATQSWSAVEGPSNICQCCGKGTCSKPTDLTAGGRSRLGSRFGRPRGFGKREALDEPSMEEEKMVTTLGPLLVIGPKQKDVAAVVTKEKSAPAELWLLVAVGCLSLLIVLVCGVFIGKSLKKTHVVSVEK